MLFVCGVNGHGGPIRSICTVLDNMHDVTRVVASQPSRGSVPSRLEQLADEFIAIPRPRGARKISAAQMSLLRRARWMAKNTDVIHANGLVEAVVVAPLAAVARKPVVVWVHNWEVPRAFWRSRRWLRRQTRQWQWLAVSSLARDVLVSTGVARQEDVRIVPNPIDPEVARGHRVPADGVRVGYLAGTDRDSKGFDLIGPTAAALDRAEARWIIFASPPRTTNDAGWSSLFALPSATYEIRPRVANIAEAFAECDIVFAPSRRESFNRVIAEAMVNGLPVVASDLSVHRELLEEGNAGILFPLDDPAAAAQALRQLIDDPVLRATLGSRGQSVARRFSPDLIVPDLREVYCACSTQSLRDTATTGAGKSINVGTRRSEDPCDH